MSGKNMVAALFDYKNNVNVILGVTNSWLSCNKKKMLIGSVCSTKSKKPGF